MEISAKVKQTGLSHTYMQITEALSQLEEVARGGRPLSLSDQNWLSHLGKSLTRETLPIALDGQTVDLLKVENLLNWQKTTGAESNEALLKLLQKFKTSLRAMLCASTHEPAYLDEDSHKIPVHNLEVASYLKASYTSESFAALFDFCQARQVFALSVNEQNGLVRTAEAEENWDMSGRQWVTDTVRCGDMERSLKPLAWRRAMLTLCRFYGQSEEVEAITKSIAKPEFYRSGGLLDGVAHIFLPETLKRDTTWFNNKRLESHGLALKAICDTVIAAANGEDYGFSEKEIADNSELIATTIVMVASYLKAINTNEAGEFDFNAPSAGPWEEIPFPLGLTWDTEAIRSGFESLQTLMALTSAKADAILSNISQNKYAEWLYSQGQRNTLAELIKAARTKILERLFSAPLPIENPHRPSDCSLAFIATSTIKMHDHPIEDVRLQYRLLSAIEQLLVRDHGIVRYAPFNLPLASGHSEQVFDSYLADNYWLLPELRAAISGHSSHLKDYGSSDCSTNDDYLARVRQARPGSEAQWCFVSVLAEGYCRQVEKLLNMKGSAQGNLNEQEVAGLIAQGQAQATRFINRSYARITPGNDSTNDSKKAQHYKANGMPCPGYAIPEAYEMVSPLNLSGATKLPSGQTAVAGANTPLAWGQASLHSASTLYLKNLRELEQNQ
jgi:hypothetical protein